MHRRRTLGPLTALALLPLALGACEPSAPRARRLARPLIGGTEDRGDPAVAVLAVDDQGSLWLGCTGTLIAPSTILTAAHCAEEGVTEYACFEDVMPDQPNAGCTQVQERHPHPSFDINDENTDADDIAVYRLSQPAAALTPIALYPSAPAIGSPIRHVGFGATTAEQVMNDGSGTKREIRSTVRQVEAQLEVGGQSVGHCYGDSGGPGLIDEQVAGVVSWGSDDCLTESWDTRVDTHVAWIRTTIAAWERPAPPADAGQPRPDATTPSNPDAAPTAPADAGVADSGHSGGPPAPDASGIADAASQQGDPSSERTEDGGCATTRGSTDLFGWVAALLAVPALARRRTRTRDRH